MLIPPPVSAAATISHVKQGGHLLPGMASTQELLGVGGGVVGETVLGGWVSRAVPGVGGGEGGCSSFSLGAPAHSRLLSTQPITPTLGQPANHAHTGPASQEVGTLTAQTFRCAGHLSGLRSGYPVP